MVPRAVLRERELNEDIALRTVRERLSDEGDGESCRKQWVEMAGAYAAAFDASGAPGHRDTDLQVKCTAPATRRRHLDLGGVHGQLPIQLHRAGPHQAPEALRGAEVAAEAHIGCQVLLCVQDIPAGPKPQKVKAAIRFGSPALTR